MIDHQPTDLTVTVDATVTVQALQTALATRGQWLPVDPLSPETVTIRELIDRNLSGPRRYGYGTIREHLLGLRLDMADGRKIRAGGQVVKNVAGYDVCRLLVGAGGELGTITEATFKLRPRPETEQFVRISCDTLADAERIIESVLQAGLLPVVLDLVAPATVVLGFAGAREDTAWQLQQAAALGIDQATDLGYDCLLPCRLSVLPSRLVPAIEGLNTDRFIARAGNGVIYHDGPATETSDVPHAALQERLRQMLNGNLATSSAMK